MRYNFAASIISKFYFPDFFPLPRASPDNAGWFGASIGSARYKIEKNHVPSCRVLPICEVIAYWFCFTIGGTGNSWKSKTTAKIKRETNLDRHCPITMPIICHLLGPPSFSLQTTFKRILRTRLNTFGVFGVDLYILGAFFEYY